MKKFLSVLTAVVILSTTAIIGSSVLAEETALRIGAVDDIKGTAGIPVADL